MYAHSGKAHTYTVQARTPLVRSPDTHDNTARRTWQRGLSGVIKRTYVVVGVLRGEGLVAAVCAVCESNMVIQWGPKQ